jgi:hypothetical protein
MAKQALRKVEVVQGRDGWVARSKNGRAFATGTTKAKVVKNAATKARKSTRPVTLRIHDRNGRIQEERTYPRSADPKASKG